MAYRNGTYVAFDGNGSTNPTEGDLKYYGLLRSWNKSNKNNLTFSDSHLKTYQVKDNSSIETLKSRLLERMKNSKNMLLIISKDTNWNRGMLNFEIEKAVDYYKLPLIVSYTGYDYILNPSALKGKWPKSLSEKIESVTANCIHIPFKEKAISAAISQFSVHSTGENTLSSPLTIYTRETYKIWGFLDK